MFTSGKSECNLCSLFVEISTKSLEEIFLLPIYFHYLEFDSGNIIRFLRLIFKIILQ